MAHQIVMVHSYGCYACEKQFPLFMEASEKSELDFKFYCVDEDDWKLADTLGIDGTPAFFIANTDTNVCIAVNNSGLLIVSEILEWIHEVLNEETK